MDENHVFTLPEDPWTYGNGSFNPDLQPGSLDRGLRERRRSSALRQRHTVPYPDEGGETDGIYAVPPYHPDYDESHVHLSRPPYADEDEEEDDHYHDEGPRQFIRRGSEGYEVRSIDREEMMRQYVESQSNLAALARAQERADRGEEDDNYGVSDGDDDGREGDDRVKDEREMERVVRRRLVEAGRYRPYAPERSGSEDDEDDEAGQIPNDLPARDQ